MTSVSELRGAPRCEGPWWPENCPGLPGVKPRQFCLRSHGGARMLDIESPLIVVLCFVAFMIFCAIALVAGVVWLLG